MYIRRIVIPVTTAADGSATVYSDVVSGEIRAIHYLKTDFADGVDFAITLETTGQNVWTESNVNAAAVRAPRMATHGVDGVASLFAAGGLGVQAPIPVADERIKIVIAQGGNAKTGAFHILLA